MAILGGSITPKRLATLIFWPQDNSSNYVVIELKKGRKNDEVIGQVLRYYGLGSEEAYAKDGQDVRGYIIVGEPDRSQTMRYQVDGKSICNDLPHFI